MKNIYCPDCNIPMKRRKSKFGNNYWWGCTNYPKCLVKCSEHPDGTLSSYPAGEAIQGMRRRAHIAMEKVFGPYGDKYSRAKMYSWLSKHTVDGHIGKASVEELRNVIQLLESGKVS